MFSWLKMLKKGLIALACFLGPSLLTVLFKLIPQMQSVTVGDLVIGVLNKLSPGLPAMTIGALLIMLINFVKNFKD